MKLTPLFEELSEKDLRKRLDILNSRYVGKPLKITGKCSYGQAEIFIMVEKITTTDSSFADIRVTCKYIKGSVRSDDGEVYPLGTRGESKTIMNLIQIHFDHFIQKYLSLKMFTSVCLVT